MATKTSGGDPKEADVQGKGPLRIGLTNYGFPFVASADLKVNPVGGLSRVFVVGDSICMVDLVHELPQEVKGVECGIGDVKKLCDAAGCLSGKEFICAAVDDEFLLDGGIASAPKDVNVIHTMVDQNKEDMRVPVQIASHRQHVYYILGKRPRSEGSSDSSITFSDDDLEGVDLPHNRPLVISLKVSDHQVDRILVDPGSSVNVLFNNSFKILNLMPKDLKQTDILMCGFNGEPVRPMGVVTLPIYVGPVTVQTEFLVVDVSSPHNAIIGRPWLHETRAVPSTYHQLIKFHPDMGIEAIRGDRKASMEFCMNEVKAKEKAVKIVAASDIADGFMISDSGPIAVFDFAKFAEEAETDAKIGGDDSSVAAV